MMRTKSLGIVLAILMLVGCPSQKPSSTVSSTPSQSPTPPITKTYWPDLIGTKSALPNEPGATQRYRYSSESESYQELSAFEEGGSQIAVGERGVLLIDTDSSKGLASFRLLSEDCKKLAEAEQEGSPSYGPIQAHQGYFVTSEREGLVCLDSQLQMTDSLRLGSGKYAHNLFIKNGVVYALDNVIYPIWILRVEVTDEGKFQELERVDLTPEDSSEPIPHLQDHWLDGRHWYIVKQLEYNRQTILRAPLGEIDNYQEIAFRWVLDTKAPKPRLQPVAENESVKEESLVRIEATTETGPPLAILDLRNGSSALARLQWEGERLTPILLHHFPDWTFFTEEDLFSELGDRVWCLSDGVVYAFNQSGKLVFEQNLEFWPQQWAIVPKFLPSH